MQGPILTILKKICKLDSSSLAQNDLFCLFQNIFGSRNVNKREYKLFRLNLYYEINDCQKKQYLNVNIY